MNLRTAFMLGILGMWVLVLALVALEYVTR